MPGDVPDRQAQPAGPELDHVVEIASHLRFGRPVPGGQPQARAPRQRPGEQAPLQRARDPVLDGEPGSLDREGDAIADHL